jgi:GNAT superfamily N-acetyltransferase
LEDARLFEREQSGLRAFVRLMGGCSRRARTLELDGVTAALAPAVPNRSVPNSVYYETAAQLEAALGRLEFAYDGAGVQAWTVWVPEPDREAAALLEAAGHVVDATPIAMALELDGVSPQPRESVTIDPRGDVADVARLNDAAYGYGGDFPRALELWPWGVAHTYVTPAEGEPLSCLMTYDNDDDCVILLVATASEARGRGLASALLARALEDARARGCATSSLQATTMGRPVYERLGYRPLETLQMWERRKPAA